MESPSNSVLDLMADCDDDLFNEHDIQDEEPGAMEWRDNMSDSLPLNLTQTIVNTAPQLETSLTHVPMPAIELPSSSSSSSFRLDAKNVFLTYPQCPMRKEELLAELYKLVGDRLNGIMVAEEDHHESSGRHLHAILLLNRRLNIRDPRYFDIHQYHGDYKSCRDVKASLRYVAKDGNFIVKGVLPSYEQQDRKKETQSVAIYDLIKKGTTMKELMHLHGSFLVLHYRQVETLLNAWKRTNTSLMTWKPLKTDGIEDEQWKKIAEWTNSNMIVHRPHGALQLYIYGTTQLGKSWFAIELSKRLRTYWASNTECFWDGFNDDVQLVVFDEFNATHTITFLNQFLDGTPMNVRMKGGQFHKTLNPPMIILANYSLRNVYSKVDDTVFDCLSRRLLQICVATKCPLAF